MVKVLDREKIKRMTGAGNGVVGSSGGGDIDLSGYATQIWTTENFVSIEFFRELFRAYDSSSNEILPNDTTSVVASIKAMVGTWTEQYLTALGNAGGGGGGGGGAQYLNDLLDVQLTTPLTDGQALVYNATIQKWVNGAAGVNMTTVWNALSGSTNEQINASHLSTALSGYVTTSAISDMATQTWVGQQGFATQTWVTSNFITIAYFDRLFRAYNNSTLVSHNDTTSTIDNIKAMFGFWTDFYLSALGTGGVSSVSISLSQLADVNVAGVTNGQVLSYNSTNAEWVPVTISSGGTDMNTVWTNLAAATNEQINISHLTTALSTGSIYVLLSNDTAQDANLCYDATPGLHYFRCSGANAPGDGFILQWSWRENSIGGQIWIDDDPTGMVYIRNCTASSGTTGTSFNSWRRFYTDDYHPGSSGGGGVYLPLTGGTMSGTIDFIENKVQLNFRPNLSGYKSGIGYKTYKTEALVFANQNSNTNFMFFTGVELQDGDRWDLLGTPAVQIRNQSLFVNYPPLSSVPSFRFVVNGQSKFLGSGLFGDDNGIYISAKYDGDSSQYDCIERAVNGGTLYIHYYNSGNVNMVYGGGHVLIGTNGDQALLTVGGGIWAAHGVTALSDIRHKNIIRNISANVYDISRMPAVIYQWKDGKDTNLYAGSIAQEWQKVLPEVVMTSNDKEGTLSMQYGVAALMSSIIIARKVVDHEDRIKQLEKENKELKERLNIA